MIPRSASDLIGQPVIGFVRVSTDMQNLSPATQRRSIERYAASNGLNLLRTVELTISGKDAWRDPAVMEITQQAEASLVKAVLVARLDRMGRSTRTDLFIDDLTAANAVLIDIASDQISGNPAHRRAMRSGIATARNESDLISERVADGIRDRNQAHHDQWGRPPFGFHRTGGEPSVLEIDPASIEAAVDLFRRYSTGTISITTLAVETGRNPNGLKDLLANRIYNGWVNQSGHWTAAPWRDDPPVSDSLFAAVQSARARRSRGGGPHDPSRPNPWRGILRCQADHRLTLDGYNTSAGVRYQRLRHVNGAECLEWGPVERKPLQTYTAALEAQIQSMAVDDATVAAIVGYLNAPQARPTPISFRQEREAAYKEHRDHRITGAELDSRIEEIEAKERAYQPQADGRLDAAEIKQALTNLHTTWMLADEAARAAVITGIYESVRVKPDGTFADDDAATLTPDAEELGMTLALSETVECEACPRGLRHESLPTIVRISIRNRPADADQRLRAVLA